MTPKLYLRNARGEFVDRSPLTKARRFFEHEIELFRMHLRFIGWARVLGVWFW